MLGRGRIQWARNALCKKYKAPAPKKGRVQKHILKGSQQKRQSGRPGRVKPSNGSPADKKKGSVHKSNKPGRKQSNIAKQTIPWLFSQASGFPASQDHHIENNKQIFDISDDSEPEDKLEIDLGELRNDLPLSDPISDFSSLQEASVAGDGRAGNSSIAEENRVPVSSRERSRSPLSSRGGLLKQASRFQVGDCTEKRESALNAREVGPAADIEKNIPAEREVGPAPGIENALGYTEREVGPATGNVNSLGPAEREVGPDAIPCLASSCGNNGVQHDHTIKTKLGKYGVISLFDGVSSVVRSLTKKLGCPPTAILLAENDEAIRRLVCAEFGYPTDEKWGYTAKPVPKHLVVSFVFGSLKACFWFFGK